MIPPARPLGTAIAKDPEKVAADSSNPPIARAKMNPPKIGKIIPLAVPNKRAPRPGTLGAA
jgi:hypothetical protein